MTMAVTSLHCALGRSAGEFSPICPSLLLAGGRWRNAKLPSVRICRPGSSWSSANYGKKEYGSARPPYKVEDRQVEPSKLSSGGSDRPKFWNYSTPKSFRDYTSPKSYGAPRNYGIPVYSPTSSLTAEGVITAENIVTVVKEAEPELGGVDGGSGNEGGDGGGGGGGGGDDDDPARKMSMSQKLTLFYAALLAAGGVMGYAKSGSGKSLLAGGGAALILLMVYTQLPVNPVFASWVGFGISAVLLGSMGGRFKKSGKFMPSGLVAVVSLIMTGGYLHGILRTTH